MNRRSVIFARSHDSIREFQNRYTMKFLYAVLFLSALVGCASVEETRLQRSVSDKINQQIREFTQADANAVVTQRLNEGNTKFLEFAGVAPEPSFVPGLSQAQILLLINAKLYERELFYYYHDRTDLGSGEQQKALWDARVNYAERVNRRLFEALQTRLPRQ